MNEARDWATFPSVTRTAATVGADSSVTKNNNNKEPRKRTAGSYGQPKPEVTWYKNGQAISEYDISCYEFFEHQYIHMLHLHSCTKHDAAVYQITAKNHSGMICCSAHIEVECSSENPQLPPNRKDDVDTGWKHETEIYEAESARQMDEKGHPYKEEERISLGTPLSADSSLPKSNRSGSLQLLASDDMHISSSEKPLDVKGTRKSQAVYDPNHTEELAEGSLLHNSSNTPNTQDVDWHQTMHSKVSWPMDGALNHEDPDDEDLNPSHQYPKVQKYISSSRPLSQAAGPVYPGSSAPVNKQVFAQVSSEDSDSDYELCPEITLTYTEEFSDDDLEYLECSDVMTDYSNAVWQRHLQGTDCVFLLESDDEELEFSECCLGGCGHFLSEMGYWSQVSDNTEPMDVTPGFWGFRSQRQEVEVRSSQASTDSPSSLQPGMTLTLGPHQDGTLTVTDQGRYKLPTASGAAENGYPGIQGETRDCRQAEEEAASDNLLNMDKAPTERKPGELEKSGTHQSLGTAAERRAGGKDLLSTEGSQKPVRVRRPGIKGKPKKRNAHLKESATEDTFNLLYPGQPANHPLTQSDQTESSWARAEATDLNLQFHAEECAISPRIEQQAETLQTPTDSLPRGGDRNATGAEWWLNTPCEASQVPGQSEPPQVRIQQTVGERGCLSQTPASAGPVEAETPLTGTNGSSLPNSGGIHKDNASLAQYLEVESWTQSPQHEEKQDLDKGHNAPGGPWGDQELEWGIAEAEGGYVFPCEFSEPYPQDGHADLIEPKAPSVASPGLRNTILTMENMFDGPGSREGVSGMERFEAGDHGTCCDTMGSAPVGKYLPQEICSMDPELADGQGKASDLCPPDDTKLEVLLNAQSSDSPRSTCENGKDRSQAGPSLFVSTFTWAISQGACEGTSGGSVAEVESSTSVAACRRTDQGRPLPSHTGGLEERQPPSSENNAFLQVKEEDEETKDTTDIPPKPSSMVTFPQEKPTMLTEGLQVTRESEDTSAMTMAAKVYPTKYLAASIAENNQADGTEENSPQAPEETVFQLPASVPWGHILNGSTAESIKEIPCMVPRAPETHAHVLQLSEGEKFCSNFLLQIGNQSTDKSQMVDRADHRTLQENFQEKGSETKKKFHSESSPHQSSLSEDSFQESLPSTSAVQEEICLTPLDHSPRNFKEKRGQSSGLGTSISMVAEGTVEDDSQALSNVLPLSNYLPEDSTESGPGSGEPGNKLKIITLEASVSEIWPPRQPTDSKYKESEAVPIIPGRIWALSEVLKADASVCELDLTETAVPASSPQCESHSTLVHNREIHGYQEPVSSDDGRSLSSQHLSQLRPLESSVDPIDDKESCTTNSLSEASKTREKKNINKMSQTQEETQLKVDQPAFFKQLLTHPQILESSVDPIDETGVMEWARAEQPEPPRSTPGLTKEGSQPKDGNLGQQVEVQSAIWHVPYPEGSGETIPSEKNINQNQGDSERGQAEQSQNAKAKGEVQPATLQVPRPDKGGEIIPSECNTHQVQVDSERSFGEAVQSKHNKAEVTSPTPPPSSCLAIMTHATVGVETDATDQIHDVTANDIAKQRNHQYVFSDSKERGKNIDDKCANHLPSSSGLLPPEGSSTNFSTSNKIEEAKTEELQTEETKPLNSPGSPATTWAFISGDCVSENAPKSLHDPCQQGTVGSMKKFREEETAGPMVTKPGKFPEAQPAVTGSEEAKKKQENSGSGRIAEGVKKKILSRVAALRLRLEEKENVRKASSFRGKIPKLEPLVSRSEKKDQKEPPCRRGGKAPVLLRKIQAEMVPDRPGNVKLSCQFAEIHEDSTIWWTKDSESIAQVQRSAGDHSTVSLAIVQASQKDQGFYHCCIKNSYGKVTAEFNLTAEVLAQLSSHQDVKGCEEIEFSQLIFKDDFLNDSYFGGSLRGQIATEELHFGEGVHRKAFRSTVMQGLMPVFEPGHACVLKVHNAIAYGTRNNDELIQRNYKLAAQECYVQNTARYYAKIYAAEAQPLEGFGEVPEIIPIFLIHRPENNIPYATVEEELIGEFVKYSIRDGKEINFLRRESEAGQKCCTFQHWVYQKTSGSLLVTDMQGVGMKLTDVGIATLAKGYKGFKGNCSMTFIDQFKALHQCNKYCKMLGLKSLQSNNQKHKKPSVVGKSKVSRTPQQ